MKQKVARWQAPNHFVVVDDEATAGAVVGNNLRWPDGTLVKASDFAGGKSITDALAAHVRAGNPHPQYLLKKDYTPGGGGAAAWGGITGALADQTDLKAVLDAKGKVDSIQPGDNITVDVTDPRNPKITAAGGGGQSIYLGVVGDGQAGSIAWPANVGFLVKVTIAGIDYILPALKVNSPAQSLPAYIAALNPVAYWRMNEASGATKLVDNVAGEQATLAGDYSLAAPGLLVGDDDPAVLFTSGYANTTASSKWALGASDFSAFCVAKWTSGAFSTVGCIRDGRSTNILYLFTVNRTAAGQVGAEGWNWNTQKLLVNGTYNDDKPHVLGLTYEAAGNTMRLYVDGALKVTQVQTGPYPRPTAATMMARLANNFGSQAFPGTLDEYALFDTKLTDLNMANMASLVFNGHT